jgi:hypothetical protein
VLAANGRSKELARENFFKAALPFHPIIPRRRGLQRAFSLTNIMGR